jgi:hypothetical protein
MASRPQKLPDPAALLALVMLSAALPAGAQDSIFHLRNGDRVTGRVVSEEGEMVVLETPWQPRVALPRGQILRREPAPSPSPLPDALVSGTPSPTTTIAGEAQVGANFLNGQRMTELYYGRLKLTLTSGSLRNTLDLNAAYGETDDVVSANRLEGSLKADYTFAPRWYGYGLASGGYDEVRLVEWRVEGGPGVGYRFLTGTNLQFNVEAGGAYLREEFSGGQVAREDFSPRLAQDSTVRLSRPLMLQQKCEYFPRNFSLENQRVKLEATLSYLLMAGLSLNVTVFNLYETNPAFSVTRNDFQLRSSVGVKF